ncbi:pleckstrin homology domain-containing family G member 3 isoform X2 [Simochromis diagramma]|uniref:pleckstrin homology domain-containing family G member 3 isoform X2 n=1 Tax=Simochromis diagramma TaxID=43689 RepID=UPI001A7EC76E|nr:pleckstrin homology domain-containing family G member 3 isoform X2 [Simochromis diagramma]
MPEGTHSALYQGPMGEESPQLSSPLSNSDHVQGGLDLGPYYCNQVCMEPLDGEGERPVSLVSSLSSGSSRDSHSLFGSTAVLPSSTTPPIPSEEDIDLELSPAEGTREQAGNQSPTLSGSRHRWQEQLEARLITSQWNNNNGTANRKATGEILHIPCSPVVADAMAPNPKLTYVDRVVMEIMETERMYVKDLRSIVEDYLAHIIDIGNLPIRPEQVCALFGNIEDIYEFNSELLESLDMCENDPVAIAQCFVNKSEYFEIYTQYCTNYPNSVAALTDCMRSKTLAKFFRDRQAALKRSLPLGSYLLKPVQRILKYHLLLQEIAKHFDPDEEGYEVIQEAIDTMTGVAWYINDMKRKHEHAVRVQEIQSLLINWKGPDLTTYGELVLEGTFHVLRAKNTRTLFLFEKMLLITKKRGEHYVYKIHILCSTLMLLDSAKDPLLFSVIHFKRPKQPHTVQAKTVEEKRLWAHHIKRLILENHSTIVPQRAKEAILDNSNYLGKYQYSPEKLKKVESCQPDDFHLEGRNGRRRSEPAKQIRRSTKAVLKHADSEGALLGARCSLQPATSVSTLTSSLGEPQAESPCVEDLMLRRDSLEELSPTDRDPKQGYLPSEGGLEPEKAVEEQDVEDGESYKEDILMGDDQDDQNEDIAELKTLTREEVEKHEADALKETCSLQVSMQEPCNLDCLPQVNESNQLEEDRFQCPESPVTSSEQETETSGPRDSSRETGEEEEGESDSSGLQVEEASVLINGELSEEEEEVISGNESILPSSVLDQASVIAGHFRGSLSRRSSVMSEDMGSLVCPSESVDDDAIHSPSACMDFEKQTQMLLSSSAELKTSSEANQSVPVRELGLNEGERRSTLSKQDRLLIHKIRQYYEHAEHQDANFSIRRRESLSYIPAGLVRNLSQQLNDNPAPQERAVPALRKGLSQNRPTSWSVFDLPGLQTSQNTGNYLPQRSVEAQASCNSISDNSGTEEEFRPSSEMLKVWQDMENEGQSQEAQQDVQEKVSESLLEVAHHSSDTSDAKTDKQPPQVLDESEMSTASNTLSTLSPIPTCQAVEGGSGQPSETPVFQEIGKDNQGQLPKIISFRTSMDEDQILQDMGKMKNKVFQLARQYSQRIKNNKPVVWQRSRETANQEAFRDMPAVHEEKLQLRKRGKPSLRLPTNACSQAVIPELHSPSPALTPSSGASSQSTITCPQSPEMETFHWPDVQELRSKYSDASHSSKITHSCTVLSGMDRCNGCEHKYSSSSDLRRSVTDPDTLRKQSETTRSDGSVVEDWPPHQKRSRLYPLLCRWKSLDHMPVSLPLHEVQNLQEPARTCLKVSQAQEGDNLCPEGVDSAAKSDLLSSGKTSESKLVRSLREKFQNLSTSS